QVARAEQIRSGHVAANGQAFDFEPEFERISNGEIIADDDDDNSRVRRFVLIFHCFCLRPRLRMDRTGVAIGSRTSIPALIWLKSAKRRLNGLDRYRIAQDALEASAFESRIPAIKAMRTRSERLAACILIIRLAR